MIERPIVFFDIESTGVDAVKDRIVEFGAATIWPDGKRTKFCQRFNPGMPIPAEASAIHGITDEDVKECPPFSQFAPKIVAGLRGKDIGVYNGWRLDIPMLDEELRRCKLKLDLTGVRVVDCFGVFSKKEPRKLEDAVRRYCGRDIEGAHNAGADAEATLDVFLGQIQAHDDLAAMALSQLSEFSRIGDNAPADLAGKLYTDKDGDICYAFGKHKGEKVKDELGYADWMLSKDFPSSTCDVLKAELDRLENL